VFDLELADEVEIAFSLHKKRRSIMKSERSAKNDAAGKNAQTLKEIRPTDEDGSEDAQVVDYDESHEGSAATASHPMNSDTEQTSRDDGSANKHSKIRSTSRLTASEDRLSELADYRNVHGHCNVPQKYSENVKLGKWVATQRYQYSLHLGGKRSSMTLPRIEALESHGFEWGSRDAPYTWEDRLSELANYRKIHRHCHIPQKYSENAKLGTWVSTQRRQYSLHLEEKTSQITLPRIQALESLGFEWSSRGTAWEDRLSELANYRKIHGHCNVPQKHSENVKLGTWVKNQRTQYSLHLSGKTSAITLPHIQALESLGFEWCRGAAWEERLSELANYRNIHGHCNVPQ
jgi:transposase-like protein